MRSSSRINTVPMITLAVLLSAGVAVAAPAAQAAQNPFERGPAPTDASLEAARGPLATAQFTVASSVSGFGGGVVYYPTDTSQGTFGAVALAPGFTAAWSSIGWLGPRIASHGFVVIGIETDSRFDQPASRGSQLLAALGWLTTASPVRGRIDAGRLAVGGHAMGGDGSLQAASLRPSLQAALAIAPSDADRPWHGIVVPTMVIAGESDGIGSPAARIYDGITRPEKAYLELNDTSLFLPQPDDVLLGKFAVVWLKRFVDNDTRYEQFLCPGPSGPQVSIYRATCPMVS